jgi:hypothetical protein
VACVADERGCQRAMLVVKHKACVIKGGDWSATVTSLFDLCSESVTLNDPLHTDKWISHLKGNVNESGINECVIHWNWGLRHYKLCPFPVFICELIDRFWFGMYIMPPEITPSPLDSFSPYLPTWRCEVGATLTKSKYGFKTLCGNNRTSDVMKDEDISQ